MKLRNCDLDKQVTLREVYELLHSKYRGTGEHEIDLGDFGYQLIACDDRVDVNSVIQELGGNAQ